MKLNDKIDLLEQKIDRLTDIVKTMSSRAYSNNLLTRYKLKGYVVKKDDGRLVLEDPEKTGWYVEASETRIDVYEDGLLKSRIASDNICLSRYWPNRVLYTEIWKDLTTGFIDVVKTYTEKGELAESTQIRRDYSGKTVHEYAQTFEHTEKNIDEEHGRLIKTTEFWNDLIVKNETSYRVAVTSEEKGKLMYERISTVDDDVHVKYGEHEKLGNVVARIENCDFSIQPVYDEEGICILTVIDKRLVGNPKKWIYLKETCRNKKVMTDWEKLIEYVKKKKYKKVELKRHWYDFGDRKFTEKVDEILRRSVILELVDLEKVEFVKGTLVSV